MIWLIIIASLALIAWSKMPIGIGLGLTGLVILHFVAGGTESLAIPAVWNVFTNFTFSAIPVFIVMGEILLLSGVSRKMYDAVAPLFDGVPGKLLHSNIAVCTLFGSVSGTSTSTAAAIGSVAYPELKKRGYHLPAVASSLAAGGTLGLLIPPSLSLLIYGASQEVSIGRLFLAGILPGLMIAALFMAFIAFQATRHPDWSPVRGERTPWSRKLKGLLTLWPIAFLVASVLGTLYAGLATPTEAAGLGVLASVIIGFMWGSLTIGKVAEAFFKSAVVMGALGLVLLGALILAQSISIIGLPQTMMAEIARWELSPWGVIVVVSLIYLLLGCFFEGISLMLMTLPIVYPVLVSVGFDPVWSGVYITLMIEIGMLTPPVGLNLFVLSAISNNEVSIASAARAAIPYWFVMLGAVCILVLFPQIVLFVPNLVFG
jgi:tripartite ATP-independent transporter DctM subunit